jgi:hypothetical protein
MMPPSVCAAALPPSTRLGGGWECRARPHRFSHAASSWARVGAGPGALPLHAAIQPVDSPALLHITGSLLYSRGSGGLAASMRRPREQHAGRPPESGLLPAAPPATSTVVFALPPTNTVPGITTLGPDGNLWFTRPVRYQIRRITEFHLPTSGVVMPDRLTCGPDGTLWFTDTERTWVGAVPRARDLPPSGSAATGGLAVCDALRIRHVAKQARWFAAQPRAGSPPYSIQKS